MEAAVAEPRRLKGHSATVTCCIASRHRPGLVVTSGEDGRICWFDMRCKDVVSTMDAFQNPISSLCFKTGNEDIIYVSSGTEVKCFDVHLLTSWKPLESYNYNKDEINQIVCNSKSSFLASADDCGDVKIIDIHQHCLYKTLRAGHTSICSSVQFLPWRPWEVITGGLDSKLVMWDFSKGRPYKVMDFGMPEVDRGSNTGQCLNPAFIHAIAVPDIDMLDRTDKICAVARGDGIVDLNHIELELAATKSRSSKKPHKRSQLRSKANASTTDTDTTGGNETKRIHLDYSLGGHTAAVSCMAFSLFGEKGKLISGGNDKFVKVWDLSRYISTREGSDAGNFLCKDVKLSRKVNWLCTTPCSSENLVVCDTTKVVKVYTVS